MPVDYLKQNKGEMKLFQPAHAGDCRDRVRRGSVAHGSASFEFRADWRAGAFWRSLFLQQTRGLRRPAAVADRWRYLYRVPQADSLRLCELSRERRSLDSCLRRKRSASRVGAATLAGAIQFFMITNFAVWVTSTGTYAKTLPEGWRRVTSRACPTSGILWRVTRSMPRCCLAAWRWPSVGSRC